MTEIFMERRGSTLVPCSAHFAEELESLPFGKPLRCKITQARSLPHNSLYWVCLKAMADAGAATSKDDIHDATKMKCDLVRVVETPDGRFYAFPDSTAFSKLDQRAFNEFFKKAVDFWKSSMLWDYLPDDLRKKIEEGNEV